MGLFNKKNEGGLMDVIRCDEASYLIWKWRPNGQAADSTKKENSIRYGSSLRVKEGEVAIFVYPQKDGTQMDHILGPYDETIKTANFPILSSIVGAAFGGASPFQAEIYFINLAGVIQTQFAVPFFEVYDPRFLDYAVPVAVRGTISFSITDYKEFIKLHRLIDFDLNTFQKQIKDGVIKYVKGVVANIPGENNIPVIQLERKILQINEVVEQYLKPRLAKDFGVSLSAMDIATIEIDKSSQGYRELKAVTQDITTQTVQAQAAVNITQMEEMQQVQMENLAESQRIQREEMQRAQKLQTESSNLAAHQINQQTAVGIAGAQAFGEMGAAGGLGVDMGSGGGFNPTALMAGMAVGGAIGQNMAGMMNGALSGLAQPQMGMMAGMNAQGMPQTGMQPPPIGVPPLGKQYNIAVNGQSTGPYDMQTLAGFVAQGQLTPQTLVWCQGMAGWQAATTVQELASLFAAPPVPPIPPVPPAPPIPPVPPVN